MKTLSLAVLILNLLAAVPAQADQSAGADAQITVILKALVAAQAAFDATRLDQLLAPDYIEISPVGEVDPRAKVLGFYAPEKKGAAGSIPRVTLDQITTRVFGDTALAIARVSFAPPGASQSAASMRAVFALRAVGGRWLLVSSQYTPIREKRE